MSLATVRNPSAFKYVDVRFKPKLLLAKGMLSPGDLGVLYSLGLGYRGEGQILDLGSFCGASAYCLANGLIDAGHTADDARSIHCFDLFDCSNQRMRKYINEIFYSYVGNGFGLTAGNVDIHDFRDVFDFQTACVRQYLHVHQGCLLELDTTQWGRRAIEIANVDIAKTMELNDFIIANFYPNMIQNGWIYHQDVLVPNHWYLMLSMHFLRPQIVFDFHARSTGWLYRVDGIVTKQQAADCIQKIRNLQPDDMLSLLKDFLSQFPEYLHNNIRRCFAFGFIEQFRLASFSSLSELLAYFEIDIHSNFSIPIHRLCGKLELSME